MPDSAAVLHRSARILTDLDSSARLLRSAATDLRGLDDRVISLRRAANGLDQTLTGVRAANFGAAIATAAEDVSHELAELLDGLVRTARTISGASTVVEIFDDRRQNWLYFRWGLGIGAFVVIMILIGVLVYQNRGG